MSLPEDFSVAQAATALDQEYDGYDRALALGSAFLWSAAPQGDAYWDDQQRRLDDGQEMTGDAAEQIKRWIAEATGFTPVGKAAQAVVDKLKPDPRLMDGQTRLAAAKEAERQERDAFPARAINFGQAQMMSGLGHWDNARYMVFDDE